MINVQSVPQRSRQVIAQKASNDFLLFNMNDGNYYALNDVGQRIWELCDGSHSVAQLVEILTAEYEAPAETLTNDILELLGGLLGGKLIVDTTRVEPQKSSGTGN